MKEHETILVSKSMTDLLLNIDTTYRTPFSDSDMIGRGGFGKVYKVYNKLDNQYYAIKKIPITKNNIRGALHEIRILARVNHYHVIRYYNSWIEAKPFEEGSESSEHETSSISTSAEDDIIVKQDQTFDFFIQMEYCQCTLKSYMLNRCAINMNDNKTIFSQIANGLYFLHVSGIIHRDIKPENILIYNIHPIHVKISDFGLAKVLSQTVLTDTTMYLGSVLYASPEQYKGLTYSYATDVFSLGIVLFELYSFFTTDMERIYKIYKLRNERCIEDTTPYSRLILDMTNADPTERPTIQQIQSLYLSHSYEQSLHVLWCRDIIWEIVGQIGK